MSIRLVFTGGNEPLPTRFGLAGSNAKPVKDTMEPPIALRWHTTCTLLYLIGGKVEMVEGNVKEEWFVKYGLGSRRNLRESSDVMVVSVVVGGGAS